MKKSFFSSTRCLHISCIALCFKVLPDQSLPFASKNCLIKLVILIKTKTAMYTLVFIKTVQSKYKSKQKRGSQIRIQTDT